MSRSCSAVRLCGRKALVEGGTHRASRGLLVLLPRFVALVAAGHFCRVWFSFFVLEDSWGPGSEECGACFGIGGIGEGKRGKAKALKAAAFGRC
jgi:hypothetical protein